MSKSKAITLAQDNPKFWANKINTAWRQAAQSYIEVGKMLQEAKAAVGHGNWQKTLDLLEFDEDKAQRLMKIAKHPILTKPAHGRLLPPSYKTLEILTRIPETALIKAFKKGEIHPNMERDDAEELLEMTRPKPEPKPEPKPTRSRIADDAEVVEDEDNGDSEEDNEPTPVRKPMVSTTPPKGGLDIAVENFANALESVCEFAELLEEQLEKAGKVIDKKLAKEAERVSKVLAHIAKGAA